MARNASAAVVLLHDTHKVSAGRRSAIAWAMRNACWAWANVSTTRRMRQPGSQRGIGPTGIAMEHRRAGGNARPRPSARLLPATDAPRRRGEESADGQAKLARAADDDMVSISRRLRGDLNFFSLGWLNDAAGAAQEPGKYIVMADQQRCQGHAEHQRDQHGLYDGRGNQMLLQDHAQQQQGELAAMPQRYARAPGIEGRTGASPARPGC